ncbi:MAG: ABC transporter permease [Opitutales bacterium TMED158]|nr:MAG: ABC transporter permease [Opitutales bacterium TMED158]
MGRIFSVPGKRRSRTSDVFRLLAKQLTGETVTLRSLMERLGDRTFGALLVLVAAFNIIPFVSLISGMLVAALGFQMFLGKKRAWLPGKVLDWPLPADRVRSALLLFEPRIRSIERWVRPRWHFTEAPVVDRMNGLAIAILGVIVALPIPFANLAPALAIIVMGLGLLERDGMIQFLSLLFALASMGFVYWLVF